MIEHTLRDLLDHDRGHHYLYRTVSLVLPRFTKEKSYLVYEVINTGRGNIYPPRVKETFFSILTFFFLFFFFSYFFLRQPPSHSLLLPADRQPLRSRVGFYHLVAGLLNPTALLTRAKFFNLPVPIGQDFLILLPYMTDRSIITDCQHGLNSWAPANCAGVLTTAPARYFMK